MQAIDLLDEPDLLELAVTQTRERLQQASTPLQSHPSPAQESRDAPTPHPLQSTHGDSTPCHRLDGGVQDRNAATKYAFLVQSNYFVIHMMGL